MAEFSCRPRQVDGEGAAKRRRLRRLRSWWRHEQQTVAAVLATFQHYNAPRGPRSGQGRSARRTTRLCSGRCFPPGFPATLSGCAAGPLARVQRRTVQQIVDVVPLVPLLDDPVPQMGDTVLEFFRALDLPVDEQVIAVPKISTDRVSQRLVERRLPQMVEQLVDVPTVLSPLRIAEQIVGIPAPQRGGNWSLQGPLPGQSSTLSSSPNRISERIVEQIAVSSPVERISGRIVEQIAVSSPAERISERIVDQIVDISPGDDRGQGSSSSAGPADEDFRGVFRTFPHGKKSAECRAGQCGPAPARQLMDPGGL